MSEPNRVFVTRRPALDAAAFLGPDFDVDVFEHDRPPTPAELRARGHGARALVTLLTDRVDGALLDHLGAVRVVANHAVGVDNVDVDAATARGIWVTNTPDVLTEATADLTWALILALARRVREGERLARTGEIPAWSPTLLLGADLAERTMGILGLGRIGRAVARRARAFGMQVLYASRAAASRDVERDLDARPVSLQELLARADVLSIHCPLTPQTRHAIGARELAAMKPTALLVNTARGPIVDEAALAEALAAGRIGGAALDVYEDEPRVHPGLLGRDDVVLLPHVGSATLGTRRRMAELCLGDAARVLRGQRPLHPVNEIAGGV